MVEFIKRSFPLRQALPAWGLFLQTTDKQNLRILTHLSSQATKNQVEDLFRKCDQVILIALIRCLENQQCIKTLWNFASLFGTNNPEKLSNSNETAASRDLNVMLMHLKELVYQNTNSITPSQLKTSISPLLLNKTEESRIKQSLGYKANEQAQLQENVTTEEGVVISDYLNDKADLMLNQLSEAPFGHFAVTGPPGSGKMSLLHSLNHKYREEYFKEESKNQNRLIVVTLEETFDSKNLVGTYVCSETGEFVFKKGPLTVAAEQGLWLVLRNIEDTPSDLLSFLLPLVQSNVLQVTASWTIMPKLGFRIFVLSKTSQDSTNQHEDIQPLLSELHLTSLDQLKGSAASKEEQADRSDLEPILQSKYPALFSPINQQPDAPSINHVVRHAILHIEESLQSLKVHLLDFRPPTVVQFFQAYIRLNKVFERRAEQNSSLQLSQADRQLVIEELSDIYLAWLYDPAILIKLMQSLTIKIDSFFDSAQNAEHVAEYYCKLGREHGVSPTTCFFGRAQLEKTPIKPKSQDEEDDNAGRPSFGFDPITGKSSKGPQQKPALGQPKPVKSNFVYTSATVRLLEQIGMGINSNETCLLVGETGTGKTTAVQEIATILNKDLHVFNMNQNTDSADLFGGFKPVDLKYLLKPIYSQFLSLFNGLFPRTTNNQKFLDVTQKTYETNKVREFVQCMQHGLTKIKPKAVQTWKDDCDKLELSVKDLQRRTKKLESNGGFIFQFVEGTLIKAMQNGEWILLDEINLASESVLNKLATVIQGNHVMLNERADVVETKCHKDFRVFMCMNPPYSSAGKKQLPVQLRCKLHELYVPEMTLESDLWQIIDRNTKTSNLNSACLSEEHKRTLLAFYLKTRVLLNQQTKRGNVGLRNLCRALRFITSAIQLKYPIIKAIYDSLFTCFASHLDQQLQQIVLLTIKDLFNIKNLPQLALAKERQDERFAYVEGNLIVKGPHPPKNFNPNDFILTKSFKGLLQQLASIVAVSNYAIILEGPTSAGKTSCVNYLAQITHNHCIRINNHMHTDVQEYLGSYVPSADTGKLQFQEGVLVEAARNGYWVILDELNLAPSEVLEALNRLLDDNREIHIVETQKVVKAHPNFRIFATQNPTEGYGGRKELSEAFKNRFVMIKVRDVPMEELKEILERKCFVPTSRATLMVKTLEQLQIYRSQNALFSGKDSTVTVRDVLKWAGRVNQTQDMDQAKVALEGFLVLGERSRSPQDKLFIRSTLEKVFKHQIDPEQFYSDYFNQNLKTIFQESVAELGLPKLILSRQLQRLACLVHKCLMNKEPVLMVGETGCGKTTLCQVFAAKVLQQKLFCINCHQNTETSDFIGCMRTKKNLAQVQAQLALLVEESVDSLIDESEQAKLHEIQGNQKRAKELIKLKVEKSDELSTLLDELSCVFEWTDGILVDSMKQGGLLLIDEISLANDSVLERLNSVFEQDRTLVLSEKSSQEAVKIVAHDKFNMVATMNPGSDFGKKELSPALRNRMTEIWVESYFLQTEFLELFNAQNQTSITRKMAAQFEVKVDISDSIDLYLIISELCADQIESEIAKPVALAIFNMIGFVNLNLAQTYFSMSRKALSIRDILSIIDFIKRNTHLSTLLTEPLTVHDALRHAIELVIIDGVCLGIDVSSSEMALVLKDCTDYLCKLINDLFGLPMTEQEDHGIYLNTAAQIGVSPFVLPKTALTQNEICSTSYAFEAQTTKINLMKVLRAFTLNKPVLIEGPPGVGKTSLVENLARQAGKKLIRVNLSEQTDMMDLLGSEYPVATSGENGGQTDPDEEEIQFSWCDGVLLQAIKKGYWFLIDEMNLAQQSILEGLNAILDHRRTVYIPELNQEFVCHPDFFVFACQNPSQGSASHQTSGRKTLPKSFLNRFTKIFLDDLTQDDYRVILQRQASDLFGTTKIESLLKVTQYAEHIKKTGEVSSNGVNMRDLARLLTLYRLYLAQGDRNEIALATALRICYSEELLKGPAQKHGLLIESGLDQIPQASLIRMADQAQKPNIMMALGGISTEEKPYLRTTMLCKESSQQQDDLLFKDFLDLRGPHSVQLQSLSDCLQGNLPILILTNNAARLTKNIQTLAKVAKQKLIRILLNDRTDTTQLLGCFEQTSNDISPILTQIQHLKPQNPSEVLALEYQLLQCADDQQRIQTLDQFVQKMQSSDLKQSLQARLKLLQGIQSKFEWVDSVLVQAIAKGNWAVFENANLCNPSILDRLNSLLEEGNQGLTINEQGLINGTELREVKKHKDFRPIFVMTQKTYLNQGKDVSRALRNRCIEIPVMYDLENTLQDVKFEGHDIYNQQKVNFKTLQHFQERFDMLPCSGDAQENSSENVNLGKRISPERQTSETQLQGTSMKVLVNANIARHIQEAYTHYLDQLNSWNTMQTEGDQPLQLQFMTYLLSEISVLQKSLKERLSNEVTERQLHKSLDSLTQNFNSTEPDQIITCYHFLTVLLTQSRHLREVNQNPYLHYLASKLNLQLTTDSHQSVSVMADLDFSQPIDYTILKDLPLPPNSQFINDFKSHKNQVQQDIFVYKMPNSVISTLNQHTHRLDVLMSQLKYKNATILVIDQNKDLIVDQEKIKLYLEEQIYDLSSVLEQPNLLIIPTGIDQEANMIVASQSYLYEPLSWVRDLLKLQSCKDINIDSSRQTKLPHILKMLKADSNEACIIRQLTMQNLQVLYQASGYKDLVSMERALIEAMLHDEQSISVKDLPAAYVCTHNLMAKLPHLTSEQKSMQELKFESLAEETLPSDLDQEINDKLIQQLGNQDEQQLKAINLVARAYSQLNQLQTLQILRALYLLPFEVQRQQSILELSQEEIEAEKFFWQFQFQDSNEPDRLLQPKHEKLDLVIKELETLQSFDQSNSFATDQATGAWQQIKQKQYQIHLKDCISFVKVLGEKLYQIRQEVINPVEQNDESEDENEDMNEERADDVIGLVNSVAELMFKNVQSMTYITLQHILKEMMLSATTITSLFARTQCPPQFSSKTETTVQLKQKSIITTPSSFLLDLFKYNKQDKIVEHQEQAYKWLLMHMRFTPSQQHLAELNDEDKVRSSIFEHFVQREVIRKMQAQEADEEQQILTLLPFKKKQQEIPDIVGKAYDTWTKEDIARMEKEEATAIAVQFPSYFDEIQKVYFAGEFETSLTTRKDQYSSLTESKEIPLQDIMDELLQVDKFDESAYKEKYLKDRVTLIFNSLNSDPAQEWLRRTNLNHSESKDWTEECSAYLSHTMHTQKLKQVMNISEIKLSSAYNFYHSPLAQECKLIYQPLMVLKLRLRDITIRDEYESPLLNESLFMANYILTCFNAESTPLMKLLTSIEFLLDKLGEWEKTYASKRLNSVQEHIDALKCLVIRFRKIQILSWRNLLNWKRQEQIREDYENCVRLAHVVTKQCFDPKANDSVLKLLDLMDLFMRDSSLGIYQSRLDFLNLIHNHLLVKQTLIVRSSPQKAERLRQQIAAIAFVKDYYAQFKPKLNQVIARLDRDAREKVKTLIDVRKWTVQKFDMVKTNIDKTHRQLHKACKTEEEILLQNVQTLVLESSRKKFIKASDELLSLDKEHAFTTPLSALKIPNYTAKVLMMEVSVAKQLSYLEKTKIFPQWPSYTNIQIQMNVFMERLQEVRALNKKYLQKRAFYDLQRFMKDEGLRPNFQQDLQPLLLQLNGGLQTEQLIARPYFLKAYEVFIMLKVAHNAKEEELAADLKNTDVLRVQGFSQHLLFETISLHIEINAIAKQQSILSKMLPECDFSSETEPVKNFALSQANCKLLTNAVIRLNKLLDSTTSKLQIQEQLVPQDHTDRKQIISSLNSKFLTWKSELPSQNIIVGISSADQIYSVLDEAASTIKDIKTENLTRRDLRIISYAQDSFTQLREVFDATLLCQNSEGQDQNQWVKKTEKTLSSRVKLLYQAICSILGSSDQFKQIRKESRAVSMDTQLTPQIQEVQELEEFSIQEQLAFTKKVRSLFDEHMPVIMETATKLLGLKKITDDYVSPKMLQPSIATLKKLQETMLYIEKVQKVYLDSMAKFSYLSMRVFLYLTFQGFCGKEEPDDPEEENQPDDLEQDGMGMGDGAGGQEQNITDQIEHQEQLEGLKDYNSDEEEKEEKEEKEKNEDEEEEEQNDFEMKDDFEGDMDSEQKSDQDKQDSDKEDDQHDDVDDMLDNDMWNKNMEDMEQQQEEKEEENRSVDLEDKELQDENIMEVDKDKNAAGDHDDDEKAQEEQKEKEEKELDEGDEQDEEKDGQGDEEEDNDQSMHFDNESLPEEEAASEEGDVSDDNSAHTDNEAQPEEEKDDDADAEKDEMDSNFEADGQDEEEGQNSVDEDMEDENEQIQNNVNQAVLDDDQIQANEENKDKKQDDQANLKRQEKKVEAAKNQPNQNEDEQQADTQQADASGTDLLFQFAQNLQKKQQEKKEQPQQQNQPDQQEKAKNQIDDPNIAEDKDQEDLPPQEDDGDAEMADEFIMDDQAQQTEGKLATDQVQKDQPDKEMKDVDQEPEADAEECKMDEDEEMAQNNPEAKVDAQQQAKLTDNQDKNQNIQKEDDPEKQDEECPLEEENVEDLIEKYEEFLNAKMSDKFDLTDTTKKEADQVEGKSTFIQQELEKFDYLQQKEAIRQMFAEWRADPIRYRQSMDLLASFKQQTHQVSASLCEQLRIVLEPQLSQNLQGDFKTGKRLSMKKVISFIASNYRNDKIWLRRTLPSKRDYKILIAIDDSLSMRNNQLGFFSLEACVALSEALNRLEVGKVAVARIRDRMELVQSFEESHTGERAAHVVSQFSFQHCAQTSADTSMANFVSDANKLLDTQNSMSGGSLSLPFVIVLSDGRFNKDNVRRFMREAKEKRYLYVFVCLDKPVESKNKKEPETPKRAGLADSGLMSMKSAIKQTDGKIKLEPYLKDFPFDYYCLVQQIEQLPSALGTILVQWFSMMANNGP